MRSVAALAFICLTWGAQGQDLHIGVASEATSLDPHFYDLTPNMEVSRHIFGALTTVDSTGKLLPDLAESWQPADGTTWIVKLRPDARFSDGRPLTADDVVFSFERARNVPGSPSSFRWYLQHVMNATALDSATLRIETGVPAPLLMYELRSVSIVSRSIGTGASTADYDSGKAAIGSGPYRLLGWVRGSGIMLGRNEAYWGRKSDWNTVKIQPIANNGSRTAALLSGDVDVINFVSASDIGTLRQHPGVELASGPGIRFYYIAVDAERQVSPLVTDRSGHPLAQNPLRDVRVRKALSLAVDRATLATRLLQGQAVPTIYPALTPAPAVPRADPAAARALLRDAGFPDGFNLTLSGPNNRYPFDTEVEQAVAQMWTRIGVSTKVDAMPSSSYFSRAAKFEFSATFSGSLSSRGEILTQLQRMLQTQDLAKGVGAGNFGHFSDPQTDALIEKAGITIADDTRGALVAAAATRAIIEQQAIIPLYFPINTWGTRAGLTYRVREDEYTLANDVQAK